METYIVNKTAFAEFCFSKLISRSFVSNLCAKLSRGTGLLAWKTHAEFLHSVNFQPMWPCLVLKGACFHAGYDKISFRLIQSRFAELRAKDIFARGLFRASPKVRVGVTCKLCIERYYLPLLNAT